MGSGPSRSTGGTGTGTVTVHTRRHSDPVVATTTATTGNNGGYTSYYSRTFDDLLLAYLNSLPPVEPLDVEDDDDDDNDAANAAGTSEGGGNNDGNADGAAAATEPAATSEPPPPVTPRLPALEVTGVRYMPLANAFLHKTDDYEFDKAKGRDLIVRRGQEFTLKLALSRPFKPARERLFVVFTAKGATPRPLDGTRVSLDIEGTYEEHEWSAEIVSSEEKIVKVKVKSAPNAIIGTYTLMVKIQSRKTQLERPFPQKKTLILLFNAWCDKDNVFLDDAAEREEYVMADSGLIWRGSAESNSPCRWLFGQFDLDVRRVVIDLLEKNVKAKERRSPIKVSRKLSWVINEFVLCGRWDGKYDDGVRPSHWMGSIKILKQFAQTGYVKYGQCWVFSGLFTTFLRCLGIPARSVTNFDSAHDTDDNMTIDHFETPTGERIAGNDSVWNFHVWNEAWMARPDLDPGYGGWQAVDATRQEQSDGLYQCGPAPVVAVKRGMVDKGFDTRFVFAEVNADDVTWRVHPGWVIRMSLDTANFTVSRIRKNRAGHVISTKKVGAAERNDITLEYKYKEGSSEERAAVMHAVSKGDHGHIYNLKGEESDVTFAIDHADDLWVGSDFEVKIETSNKSDETRTVYLKTKIESCLYTGIPKATLKTEELKVVLRGKESISSVVKVTADEYLDKLDDEGLFTVFVIGSVEEIGKTVTSHENMRLKKIDLEVNSEVTGSEVKLTIEFTNPLNRKLTNCEFEVEAPKLVKAFTEKHGDVGPKEKVTREITFTARGSGRKMVVVEFDSKELRDIEGDVFVEVKTNETEVDDD